MTGELLNLFLNTQRVMHFFYVQNTVKYRSEQKNLIPGVEISVFTTQMSLIIFLPHM